MPLSSTSFAQGQSGNPNGRPVGAANRRSLELQQRLCDRGDVDPADFCSSIVSSRTEPTELKLQASNYLLPYLYNKRGTVTPPRYIDEPIPLPHPEPTNLNQVNKNIAYLDNLMVQGQIDLDFADRSIANQRSIANNIIAEEELKLKLAAHGGGADQRIIVEGGLPPLPGTDVIMPVLDGHTLDLNLEKNSGPPALTQDPEP